MPLAKETVLGYATLSGTTQNSLTAGTNQSFTVRNFTTGRAELLEINAADSVGPALMQIKSPKMHDSTYGMQFAFTPKTLAGTSVFNPQGILPSYQTQILYATDTLTVSIAGANADVVCAAMDFYYTDLSGIAARLYSWEAIQPLIVNTAGVTVTPATSSTAGNWGTSAALNSGNYNLKANTDYAVLGYNVQQPCVAVALQGTDTGNLLVGGPGSPVAANNGSYFIDQAVKYRGTPFAAQIPVINSNNAPGITVNVAATNTSTNIIVSLTLAQLSQTLASPGGMN